MTDEEIAQLAQELTPEEKTRLIRILCPAEDWDDVAGEFAMKLYGVEPNLSADGLAEILEGAVRKSRERGERVPRSLPNVLTKLRKKAKARFKSEAKSPRCRSKKENRFFPNQSVKVSINPDVRRNMPVFSTRPTRRKLLGKTTRRDRPIDLDIFRKPNTLHEVLDYSIFAYN